MKMRFFVLASFVCFATLTSLAQVPAATTPRGYMIGPGDVLTVKALGGKGFEAERITVDEDGRITIPWVNDPIVAQCKTERELQSEVIKLWNQYLKSPQVDIHVTQRLSRPPVSVIGEVTKESQFNITRKTSLLEVLSAAGGATAKNGGVVQLIRTRPPLCASNEVLQNWKRETGDLGVATRIYSLSAVSQGSNEANPEILPGDIVNVPKAAPVYVTGEVKRAGEIDLPANGLPLTQAIAMANGSTNEAKVKEVRVYRRKLGSTQPEILVANLQAIKAGTEKDIMLEPYDIVEIGKQGETFGSFMTKLLIGLPNRIPIPIP